MREILTTVDLMAAAGNDPMIIWAGQGRLGSAVRAGSAGSAVRAWYDGDAVAVASSDLSKRDRMAVRGPVDRLVPLVRRVVGEVGTGFRPFGDEQVIRELGFLAGVATRTAARGRGLSRQVCAFVTAELVKRHGRCGLMVDGDNAAAIAVYRRLGYTYRPVAAAHL